MAVHTNVRHICNANANSLYDLRKTIRHIKAQLQIQACMTGIWTYGQLVRSTNLVCHVFVVGGIWVRICDV